MGVLPRCLSISERLDNSKYKTRSFETSQDLKIRRLMGYWNRAQVAVLPTRLKNYEACYLIRATERQSVLSRDTKDARGRNHSLQWRHNHNERLCVSNHRRLGCLLNYLLRQAQIKENIKAPRHWPLGWESTVDRWIALTSQMASNTENVSIWWRHHVLNFVKKS